MRRYFLIILLIIGIVGLGLRFIDYDRIPPFAETQDEFFYSWAGMTWLTTGTPVGWSWFPSYSTREVVTKWGIMFPLVSPWIEKPPLYTLIQGSWMVINGVTDIFDVRLSLVRIVPIVLGTLSIMLVGLVAAQIFNLQIGMLAGLLFATIPTIVIGNRLSMTENLLTPILLLTMYVFFRHWSNKIHQAVFLGLGLALLVMTKNIGFIFALPILTYQILNKTWKEFIITLGIFGIGVLVHPFIGWLYDWQLFISVIKDYGHEFAISGPPELIQTIFLSPTIGRKDHFFLDGSMLLGYILLFSSPLWLLNLKGKASQIQAYFASKPALLLMFPFSFLTFLSLIASGAGFSFYGWHVFPVYPFLAILIAKVFWDLWQEPNSLITILIILILGSSTVRFITLFMNKEFLLYWQPLLTGLLLFSLVPFLGSNLKFKQIAMLVFLLLYLGVNIYTVVNMSYIFPPVPQPLN